MFVQYAAVLAIWSFIAAVPGWMAADFCKNRSTRFILWFSLPVIIVAVVVGAYPLLRARHYNMERLRSRAFKTDRSVFLTDGGVIETDFTAPSTDYLAQWSGRYLVSLPDTPKVPPGEAADQPTVECTVVADGQIVDGGSFPIGMLNSQRISGPELIIAQFRASGGTKYRLSLRIPPALLHTEHGMVRLRFLCDPKGFYGDEIGIGMIGGIGECLWLAAYGVSVAAAIRVAFNWQDAAEQRAFAAKSPAEGRISQTVKP